MLSDNLFTEMTDAELRQSFSSVYRELRRRGIIRSRNIVGDLGEYDVEQHYNNHPELPNLRRVAPGTRAHDAICPGGKRYAVKTTSGSATGTFYGLPDLHSNDEPVPLFDRAVIVKLDANYEVAQIIELTWQQFLEHKRWHKTMRGWVLPATKKVALATRAFFPKQA